MHDDEDPSLRIDDRFAVKILRAGDPISTYKITGNVYIVYNYFAFHADGIDLASNT